MVFGNAGTDVVFEGNEFGVEERVASLQSFRRRVNFSRPSPTLMPRTPAKIPGAAEMPEALRRELGELGLL